MIQRDLKHNLETYLDCMPACFRVHEKLHVFSVTCMGILLRCVCSVRLKNATLFIWPVTTLVAQNYISEVLSIG